MKKVIQKFFSLSVPRLALISLIPFAIVVSETLNVIKKVYTISPIEWILGAVSLLILIATIVAFCKKRGSEYGPKKILT